MTRRYYIATDAFPIRVAEDGTTELLDRDGTWRPTHRSLPLMREITEAQALSFYADEEEIDRIAAEMEAMGTGGPYPDDDDEVHVIIPAGRGPRRSR
jgi:hypothetical protein